jgi:CBS domain-containing protein
MVTAKDVMTKEIISVRDTTDVKKVLKLLVEKNVTGLPVISDEGYLVGMVTEKDILQMLYKQTIKNRTVSDMMTHGIVSFDENDNLIDIYKCLMENNFRRVPILSEGKLVGIISRRDIIKFLSSKTIRPEALDDA